MFLTKQQLQDAEIDPDKIRKFAELFPKGTEVTREMCIKYSDVFSFGYPGARLLPNGGWNEYLDSVSKAKNNYKSMMALMNKMMVHNQPKLTSKVFKSYPPIPYPLAALVPATEDAVPMISVEGITRLYNFNLALIFYEISII